MRQSPHEKANSEEKKNKKTRLLRISSSDKVRNETENKREAKSGEMPKAVQRASPLATAFPFCDLLDLSVRVLVATARSAGALV